MALGQAGFQTLLDGFLVVKNEKDVDKVDLNDRVKRIIKQRIQEFNIWLSQSESELRRRYELEKTYLKSQVNSLKIYSRWARPYLRAAQELEMKERNREPETVKAFNTIVLELCLLGKSKLKLKETALEGNLPREFADDGFLKKLKREYYSCVLVEFKFRGIPQRVGQQSHYVFGGRAEVTFKAYALNKDELDKINSELDKSDVADAMNLIEGTTTESLAQLQDDIDFFLEETPEKEKSSDTSNPFMALIGHYDQGGEKKDKPKKEKSSSITSDSWIEKTHLRTLASEKAIDASFKIFDIYKKAHEMPSYT